MPSFTPQIQMMNGEWLGNSQVFATRLEAECSAFYLMDGCMNAVDYRAQETTEPVNSVIATPTHLMESK